MKNIAEKSEDIVSITNIMDVTTFNADQENLLHLKVEAANHRINKGPEDEIKRLEKEEKERQVELNRKIKLYGEKKDIECSKFTGKVLITFKTQLMAQKCIEKYPKPSTLKMLLRNIGCTNEVPL